MSPSQTNAIEDITRFRLPTNVVPTHYEIVIKTDLVALTFEGVVQILLDVFQETSTIEFNTANLDLGSITLNSEASKNEQAPTSQEVDLAQERIKLHFEHSLPAKSKAQLKIAFKSELGSAMSGYYRSAYQVEGTTKYYSLTLLAPTSARRVFPCWDEPAFKATYNLTMVSRIATTNIANMGVISEDVVRADGDLSSDIRGLLQSVDHQNEWKVTKFGRTPPMSTYIVAFANGDFAYLEAKVEMPLSKMVTPVRVYALANDIHQAQFVLDVKVAALPLYEEIFDVEYPLPKLDTLISRDFEGGAMENWGLIIGANSVFLMDPARPDLQSKKRVAAVESHEIAHMWFGNITTMKWWDYIYLNEGFATLMGEVVVPSRMFPDWNVDSDFILTHLSRALSLDAKLSSHPIEIDCPDARNVSQVFDALSYSKAGSVMRMLLHYVGEETFLKGVSIYLKKNLFANTVTEDLWKGISAAAGVNVTEFMDNWITKVGFPVLSVTEDETGITVRQDRFLETGPADPQDNETIWNIPLFLVATPSEGQITDGLSLREKEAHFAIDTSKPFKLNGGTRGCYRVLYTPERLAKIAQEAAKQDGFSAFGLNDRLGLVHDVFALSKAGLSEFTSALTVVDKMRNETEYLVWAAIGDDLVALESIWWEYPEVTSRLGAFRRSLFVPIVDKLGYDPSESDTRQTKLLRQLAITQAGDEPKVIEELIGRFKHFVKTGDDSRIPPDLQTIIFATAVKHGGQSEYEAIIDLNTNAKTTSLHVDSIKALCAAKDPAFVERTINVLSNARDQDVIIFFANLSRNLWARRQLHGYFLKNFDEIYKRFEGNFSLYVLVKLPVDFLASREDLETVERFFQERDTAKYSQALAQSKENVRSNIKYIERSTADLEAWLKDWEARQA